MVLAAASSVLKAALKPGGKPEEHIIVLPGIELYLIEVAVRYAYTGEIMVPKQYMTTDCLSMVIAVLTELGFELSSVITRLDFITRLSDTNGKALEMIFVHCIHVLSLQVIIWLVSQCIPVVQLATSHTCKCCRSQVYNAALSLFCLMDKVAQIK